MIPISGKCIWVTGATSGLGKALVKALVTQDNYVIASGRDRSALIQLMSQSNGKVIAFPFDLASTDIELIGLRQQLLELTDYLDMVICCAGVCHYEDDLTFPLERYRETFEVNVLGVVKTLHLAMPLLKQSEYRAHIVLLSSLSSIVPFPRAEAYGASKAALDYFAESLRMDLSGEPVDITLVRPGFVKTPMTDANDFAMPFMVSAELAAKRILVGVAKRKKRILFPRRLSWPLRLFSFLPSIWRFIAATTITRKRARNRNTKAKYL